MKKESQHDKYKPVVEALKIVDPQNPLGTELFDALARVMPVIGYEAVCLRWNPSTQGVEVYMTQRSPNDTAYPGEWHCPGSVLRYKEEIDDVFFRLETREFGAKLLSRRFVAEINHTKEARGHFISMVYLCTIAETEGLRGKWFPVNNLPEKTVRSHRNRIIPSTVGAFVAENTSCS